MSAVEIIGTVMGVGTSNPHDHSPTVTLRLDTLTYPVGLRVGAKVTVTHAPPPTVADQWGFITELGSYNPAANEADARAAAAAHGRRTLARIVRGRVTDEHGTPLEAS